jgi:dGTPase
MQNFELATFAVDENKSRGRMFVENFDDSKYRSIFGRDRDRIINSSAFRRLQYKTQVFVNHQGDHYRTRLTHTLEMAQIARWIAGALNANKDLAEIISLAHDLGHPPFGHAGEEALNLKMQNFGGFSHNAHTLKIITKIETRFIDFVGLNLSWETLEGVVKHNGAILDFSKIDKYILNFNQIYDLELHKNPAIEAQISAISDDIAYNNHDIEDGLRAELFKVEDLFEIPLIGEIYQEILQKNPQIRQELLVGEAKKRITLAMVLDVIEQTKINLQKHNIKTLEDIKNFPKFLVEFSPKMQEIHLLIKKFLMQKMYRHQLVNVMTDNAKDVINSLFDFHFLKPEILPKERYEEYLQNKNSQNLAEIICDYIAGMTDRFAIKCSSSLR